MGKPTLILQNILKKFQPHSCTKCGKIVGETSFWNRADDLCSVCLHYLHPTKTICCQNTIELHHGESEMCPYCGCEMIRWGASLRRGNPFLSSHDTRNQYISQVLHQEDGAKEYLEQKNMQAQNIQDKVIRDRYIRFYEMNCRDSQQERQRIKRKYNLKGIR